MTIEIPRVLWPIVAGRIQRSIIRPPQLNPHLVILGQTRAGKDWLIRWGILPVFPLERVLVLITKPGDDLTWRGWGNVVGPGELPPGFGRGPDGTPHYLMHLHRGNASRKDARLLWDQLEAEGEMILIIGDAARLTRSEDHGGFGLEGRLSQMMSDGAGNALTVIACANTSSWAASGIRDQAAAFLIGKTGAATRGKFADIADLPDPREDPAPRRALDALTQGRFLYADRADGELLAAVTTAPPAGWCSETWPPPEQLHWPGAA